MANLTLVIDDDVLKRARIRALQEGTSVNTVVREQLTRYADDDADWREAAKRLLELSYRTKVGSGSKGHDWTREDLYER